MTGQVVYLNEDIDPVPVVVAMLAEWGEVVAERIGDSAMSGWQWRVTGRYQKPRQD